MKQEQRYTFKKEERLTGEKRIENLFAHGRSFISYPLRVVFLETSPAKDAPVSILISIPKKRIKSAVRRNRLKRLVREAYRLNKHRLNPALFQDNHRLEVAFIYVKDEVSDYATIQKSVVKALAHIAREFANREDEKC